MARITVTIDDADRTRLTELADSNGESESKFAERALRRALIAEEIRAYHDGPDAETTEWMAAANATAEHLFATGAELDTNGEAA